jgi:hypothetical protein
VGDGDCDDGDPAVFPGADEICNEVDDDCDGYLDIVIAQQPLLDGEMDGLGLLIYFGTADGYSVDDSLQLLAGYLSHAMIADLNRDGYLEGVTSDDSPAPEEEGDWELGSGYTRIYWGSAEALKTRR